MCHCNLNTKLNHGVAIQGVEWCVLEQYTTDNVTVG